MFSRTSDVAIAGGGPAGLATALALSRLGFQVTVADCATPPIDKACGEGLMPDSVEALRKLGVTIPNGMYQPFKGVRFLDREPIAVANFPRGHGAGMRRTVLHELLIRHATEAGVRLIWGAKNIRLAAGGIATQAEFLPARVVIGADGRQSTIRSEAKLNRVGSERRRYGFRRHYCVAPWSEYVDLHWGPRGQLYITPVAEDEICVAFVSRHPELRLEEALEDFPAVRERLAGATHASREMGSTAGSRRLRRVQRDGVALVGDASGSVDAITGEGMGMAFKQAEALAQALAAGSLSDYAARHKTIMQTPHRMASLLVGIGIHPAFQRRALAYLAKRPKLFEALLKVHVGELPLRSVCSPQLLGWRTS